MATLKCSTKVRITAARDFLSVFRTTYAIALFRDSGISPAEVALDIRSRRAALPHVRWTDGTLCCCAHKLLCFHLPRLDSPAHTGAIRPSEKLFPLLNAPWQRKVTIPKSLFNELQAALNPTKNKGPPPLRIIRVMVAQISRSNNFPMIRQYVKLLRTSAN